MENNIVYKKSEKNIYPKPKNNKTNQQFISNKINKSIIQDINKRKYATRTLKNCKFSYININTFNDNRLSNNNEILISNQSLINLYYKNVVNSKCEIKNKINKENKSLQNKSLIKKNNEFLINNNNKIQKTNHKDENEDNCHNTVRDPKNTNDLLNDNDNDKVFSLTLNNEKSEYRQKDKNSIDEKILNQIKSTPNNQKNIKSKKLFDKSNNQNKNNKKQMIK